MSTYDWPESLVHRDFSAGIEANQLTPTSPFTKSVSVIDFLGERWRFSLSLPPAARDDAGVRAALFAKLRGKANKVNLWNMARPFPLGTMRGTPTLAANAAQGAQSISIAGGLSSTVLNYVRYSQQFSNAAWDKWYSAGSSAPVVTDNYAVAPDETTTADRVVFSTLGVGDSYSLLTQTVPSGEGARSVWLKSTGGGDQYVLIMRANADPSPYEEVRVTGSWQRFVVQANTTSANSFQIGVRRAYSEVAEISADVLVWQAQQVLGQTDPGVEALTLGSYAYAPGTLKAGDMLGFNGLLTMVADDATADASGSMTVNLCTRLRKACTSGTAVVWNKPTSTFMLADGYAPISYSPGIVEGLSAEFVEAW